MKPEDIIFVNRPVNIREHFLYQDAAKGSLAALVQLAYFRSERDVSMDHIYALTPRELRRITPRMYTGMNQGDALEALSDAMEGEPANIPVYGIEQLAVALRQHESQQALEEAVRSLEAAQQTVARLERITAEREGAEAQQEDSSDVAR